MVIRISFYYYYDPEYISFQQIVCFQNLDKHINAFTAKKINFRMRMRKTKTCSNVEKTKKVMYTQEKNYASVVIVNISIIIRIYNSQRARFHSNAVGPFQK